MCYIGNLAPHIAAHLQAHTGPPHHQRLAKELQFPNPLLLIILNPNFAILLPLFSRKVFFIFSK